MDENKQVICHYCEEPTSNPTKDHKFPISKIKKLIEKGEPLPDNVDINNNIVLACETCNILKGTYDYESFKSLGVKAIRHKKRLFNSKVASNRAKRKLKQH